ncbi:MAG: SpoVR family protein [Geminicoccaceae bacterium]
MVRHNQVICPHPGSLNPYHLGFVVWHDIERRFGGEGSKEGRAKLFEVRESDRDTAFLRRFLTPELMRELDLFSYKPRGEHLVVDRVADEAHWEEVKAKLLAQIGTGSLPVISVIDADHSGRRALMLRHEHDGRDLDMTSAEKTLQHARNPLAPRRLPADPPARQEGPHELDRGRLRRTARVA